MSRVGLNMILKFVSVCEMFIVPIVVINNMLALSGTNLKVGKSFFSLVIWFFYPRLYLAFCGKSLGPVKIRSDGYQIITKACRKGQRNSFKSENLVCVSVLR